MHVFRLSEVRPRPARATRVAVVVADRVGPRGGCAAQDGPVEEATEEDEDSTACQHWTLPAADFDGLWERCAPCGPLVWVIWV